MAALKPPMLFGVAMRLVVPDVGDLVLFIATGKRWRAEVWKTWDETWSWRISVGSLHKVNDVDCGSRRKTLNAAVKELEEKAELAVRALADMSQSSLDFGVKSATVAPKPIASRGKAVAKSRKKKVSR